MCTVSTDPLPEQVVSSGKYDIMYNEFVTRYYLDNPIEDVIDMMLYDIRGHPPDYASNYPDATETELEDMVTDEDIEYMRGRAPTQLADDARACALTHFENLVLEDEV